MRLAMLCLHEASLCDTWWVVATVRVSVLCGREDWSSWQQLLLLSVRMYAEGPFYSITIQTGCWAVE
jgi:hypothetical protein